MFKELKTIPYHQGILYGGFFYNLANLLQNSQIVTEVNVYRNKNLTNYYKNYIYHKYTSQKTNPETFIEQQALVNIYPYGLKIEKEKDLFKFNESSNKYKEKYKIYFVNVNLTKLRTHEIILIKPMFNPTDLYLLDSMNDYTYSLNKNDFFNEYNVMGFSTFEHKYFNEVTFSFQELSHLI